MKGIWRVLSANHKSKNLLYSQSSTLTSLNSERPILSETPKRIIISPPLKMPNKMSRKVFNVMNSTHPTGLHKQAANILEMKL